MTNSQPATEPTRVRRADEALIVVEGVVQHGDERGRELGFPTANVLGTEAVRLDGVYAGTVQVDPERRGPTFVAAVSVGHRPTFYGRDGLRLLEAHLLGFNGDLYDKTVRIELHVRLRPQHRYVDAPTLVRQLHLDVEATRAWACANGLEELLTVDRPTQARWAHRAATGAPAPVRRRKRRDPKVVQAARARRREELIADALHEADPAALSHEWLADRTGLPLGYLTWRFPTISDLRATS